MKKQKDHWKELLPYEKWASAGSIVLSCIACVVIIMDVLREFDVLIIGFDVFPIATGLLSLSAACLAVENWRTKRSVATSYVWIAILWTLFTGWDCYRSYFSIFRK